MQTPCWFSEALSSHRTFPSVFTVEATTVKDTEAGTRIPGLELGFERGDEAKQAPSTPGKG